jgi:hypothetical protein
MNQNSSSQQNEPRINILHPQRVPTWAVAIATFLAMVVGFLAATIWGLFQVPTNPDQPLTVPASESTTSCATKTGPELQTCCQNWSQEEGLLTTQCVGEWVWSDDGCAWECSTQPVQP